ncbi:hypothetical protein [Actinopolyspora xinjiangensis]|nr:hypothetical protein [Actinopolyspora xinjiangensis]
MAATRTAPTIAAPHCKNPGTREPRPEVALSSSESTASEPDTEQSARIFV